jgi:high-affinity iron transporter
MIFWMRRFARAIAGDLRTKLEQAIGLGAFAVVGMAFLAVVREGLETSLLFYAAAQAPSIRPIRCSGFSPASRPRSPSVGCSTSVPIRINLTTFFRWTGVGLIIVAAGILKYGVHDLQEAGVLPGLNTLAFDISHSYNSSSWYAELLARHVELHGRSERGRGHRMARYAVPVMILFLWPAKKPAPTPAREPASVGPAPPTDSTAPEPHSFPIEGDLCLCCPGSCPPSWRPGSPRRR